MSTFSEPQHWPYRLIIFGAVTEDNNQPISMRMFASSKARDAEARRLKLVDGQTAIGVEVQFLVDGGDEPQRTS